MKLLVTGVSHKITPVEIREGLAVPDADLPAAVKRLAACPGVNEAVILSTCNRVEIMVGSDDDTNPELVSADFLCRSGAVSLDSLEPYIYRHHGKDAIHHIFRVAASLDSMIVGEPQILGQLKRAYTVARQ